MTRLRLADAVLVATSAVTIVASSGCDGRCAEMHDAAAAGDIGRIDELLADDVDPACTDGDGWTPLHRAAAHGRVGAVDALLAAGVSVDVRGALGRTPLYQASKYAQRAAADRLLAQGAQVDAASVPGITPLGVAAERHHLALVDLLLGHGANVQHATNEGLSVIHRVVLLAGNDDDDDDAPTVARLVAAGAWVDTHDVEGWTPLHVAARHGHARLVAELLDAGANPGAVTNRRATPVEVAEANGHEELASLLVSRGGWRHAASAQPTRPSGAIRRVGTVVSRSGPLGPQLGDRCDVTLLPAEGSRFTCQLEVRCGEGRYYGDERTGFLDCEPDGPSVRAYDDRPVRVDGDPAAGIDVSRAFAFVDSGTMAPRGSAFRLSLAEPRPDARPDAPAGPSSITLGETLPAAP